MRILLLMLVGSLVLTSCKPKLIFTEQNRQQLKDQKISIDNVQFYNDKDIVMRREIERSLTQVDKGEIKQIDGENIQEIRIPRSTPGIVTNSTDTKIWVAFEDCDSCSIRFYKNPYDSYQVDADIWYSDRGQISYDRKNFYLITPHNDAILLVKKSQIYKPEKRSRSAKGMKIQEKQQKKVTRKDIRRVDKEEEDDFQPFESDQDDAQTSQ